MGRVTPKRSAPSRPTEDERVESTRGGASGLRRVLDAASQNAASRERLARASNWRTPVIVDSILGTIVFVVGFTLSITWNPIVGGGIAAVGLLYVALAIRRWKLWAALRRDEPDSD
jgi:hypothetical protein